RGWHKNTGGYPRYSRAVSCHDCHACCGTTTAAAMVIEGFASFWNRHGCHRKRCTCNGWATFPRGKSARCIRRNLTAKRDRGIQERFCVSCSAAELLLIH